MSVFASVAIPTVPAPATATGPAATRRLQPLQRTATFLDLRVWPGYSAAVGLKPHELPPTFKDKSMYWTLQYTKTPWGSKGPVKVPKKKKHVQKEIKKVKAARSEKKLAAKFIHNYDLRCIVSRFNRRIVERAVQAAAHAEVVDAPQTPEPAAIEPAHVEPVPSPVPNTTITTTTFDPAMPGALPGFAPSDAPTESAAVNENPSLTVTLFKLAVEVVSAVVKRKPTTADVEGEARDTKRRRVQSDAPSPSHAEARPVAGKPARNIDTGATAPTHHNETAAAASSAARNPPKLKATLSKCPPPTGPAPVASNLGLAPAQSRTKLLSRQPTVVVDSGSAPQPSSSAGPAQSGRMSLSRQPAMVIDFGTTSAPTFSPSVTSAQDTMFSPSVSSSTWSPPRTPPNKTARGKRSGAREHKLQKRKEAKYRREDKDDGAACA